jgi:hypothetical protein
MENVGILYGHLVHTFLGHMVIRWSFGVFFPFWYITYTKESGNPEFQDETRAKLWAVPGAAEVHVQAAVRGSLAFHAAGLVAAGVAGLENKNKWIYLSLN